MYDLLISKQSGEAGIQMKLEQEIIQQFLHITAHDLRAPLRSIKNSARWLREDLDNGHQEEVYKHLDRINCKVDNLGRLISYLSAYTQIGQEEEITENINCVVLLNQILESYRHNQQVQLIASNCLPVFATRKRHFYQVLQLLIERIIRQQEDHDIQLFFRQTNCDDHIFFSLTSNEDLPVRSLSFKEADGVMGMELYIADSIIKYYGELFIQFSTETTQSGYSFSWRKEK